VLALAENGKGGEHATTPRVDFHVWQTLLEMGSKDSSEYGIQTSAITAPELLRSEK
jgi:hypothetical protein